MLTYEDVKTFLHEGLAVKGYSEALPDVGQPQSMPLFDVGPSSLSQLQTLSPGSMVFATVGNGAGLILEHSYDQVFVTLRSIGLPGDYNQAERLAYDLDVLMNQVDSPRLIGTTRVLWIVRTGGSPQLVDKDNGDRYHFQATYITPAMTGL